MMAKDDHVHTYDAEGRMTCCSLEEKIYSHAGAAGLLNKKIDPDDDHDHAHDSGSDAVAIPAWKKYLPALSSLVLLLTGLVLDHYIKADFFNGYFRLIWYSIAYLPVGLPVMKEAWHAILKKEFFTEFLLMSLATLGAFAIAEYPEGVAVMLFYAIGELFQTAAVNKAKSNIKALLDVRPAVAAVWQNNSYQSLKPEAVKIGATIQIKAGEKVPLDGDMISEGSSFNTAALTGESKPKSIYQGEPVLAGMVNLDKVVELKVTKKFADSSLARILDLVQNATGRKAKTELLIRKLAKIYTPIVFFLAIALIVVPYFVLDDYNFKVWLYRALIFLVISCPCALVISIPLGYFGGIGAASRNGILFKGANYLELMTKVNTVILDKTGTLTAGVFKVKDVVTNGMDKLEFMNLLAALEKKSTHPIARAIADYKKNGTIPYEAINIEEIPGYGIKGKVNGKIVLAGNAKLLTKYNVSYESVIDDMEETVVAVAVDNRYAGYVLISDEIKEDARESVKLMHQNGIGLIVMLSGDKESLTQKTARLLGVDSAFGDLLPEDKVKKVEELKQDPSRVIAFVGDGINDAPALALSDVGIAMGAMGSDAAIEIANVVIQTDQPSKIITAIRIGKKTKTIIFQNIALAFAVKLVVLILSAGGLATMWEAVFADVGVALLAILNAVRIQRMKF